MQQATIAQSAPAIPSPSQTTWTVGASAAITLAVAGFAAKWMFNQLVENWKQRIGELETQAQALKTASGDAAMERERTRQTLETLNVAIDRISKQLDSLNEVSRQTALLGERQNVFDQRLQNYGGALSEIQRLYNDSLQRSMALETRLDKEYLRREDWTRFTNTIEAKLDALSRNVQDYKEITLSTLRGNPNDRS